MNMKNTILALMLMAFFWVGCGPQSDSQDDFSNQETEELEGAMETDSVANKIEELKNDIEESSEKLDELVNDI
jgi:PBP1b-binding outer membrane lipoprotein LpoB